MSSNKTNTFKDDGYKATALFVCCSALLYVKYALFLNPINFYTWIMVFDGF